MARPEDGQHVVLAQAVERNVLDDHHLVVILVEHRAGNDLGWVDPVAVGELAQRA